MRRAGAAFLAGLIALTLLRLWWCGRFELSPDEAYYWLWSQHLDWAYYSKGPGIALAIRFATDVLGDTERGVRWLNPGCLCRPKRGVPTGFAWLLLKKNQPIDWRLEAL